MMRKDDERGVEREENGKSYPSLVDLLAGYTES